MFQSQWSPALGFYSDMTARAQLNPAAHALKKVPDAGTPSHSLDSVTSRLDDEWFLQSFLVPEVSDMPTSFLPSALPNCHRMLSQCCSPEPLCCGRTDDAHRGLTNRHTSVAECERRRARRERNRIAAARCRDRRRMLTDTLEHEAEQLEQEKSQLEEEIAGLEREKEKLELVLEAHKPACKMEESNLKKASN